MEKGVTLSYFDSRDIAAITMCAALWSVLSAYISPIFWKITRMPFLCDMLGMVSLILALWWIRKFGAVTATGIIATIITLILKPNATHFLGFTTASVVFDILTSLVGLRTCLEKPITGAICLLLASITSTGVAGIIIGILFMTPEFLTTMFGGITFFALLHSTGGAIGSIIGIMLIRSLSTRVNLQRR